MQIFRKIGKEKIEKFSFNENSQEELNEIESCKKFTD